MTQQALINSFYNKIKNSVGSVVGNRIYNLIAPNNFDLPLITFSVVADSPKLLLNNEYHIDVNLQVNIFGHRDNGAAVLRNINETLFEDLHGFEIDSIGTVSNTVRGITELNTDADTISVRSEYRVA